MTTKEQILEILLRTQDEAEVAERRGAGWRASSTIGEIIKKVWEVDG